MRREVWDFIGFKHVNGPQEWDSIAKEQDVVLIDDADDIPLDGMARAIGDRNDTVLRLYHGLKVLHEAEETGVFDREDRFYQRKAFPYSHLWTGLGYEGIKNSWGIKDWARTKAKPVPRNKVPELGQVCRWLYGSHKDKIEP